MKWAELVKKYNMVNGPAYYDTGTRPKVIMNAVKATLVKVDKDTWEGETEYSVIVYPIIVKRQQSRKFKKVDEVDAYLSKLPLSAVTPVATDDEICKFISNEYMAPVKDVADLKARWTYIRWKMAIQMTDRDVIGVYRLLVDGTPDGVDDQSGIGSLGMTLNDFEAWLVSNGITKAPKPKRIISTPYYD